MLLGLCFSIVWWVSLRITGFSSEVRLYHASRVAVLKLSGYSSQTPAGPRDLGLAPRGKLTSATPLRLKTAQKAYTMWSLGRKAIEYETLAP